METVNLKTAIVFRTLINGKECAFSTKTFRGKRLGLNHPQPKDMVLYKAFEIVIESAMPWYTLETPVSIEILWSNVLSFQEE